MRILIQNGQVIDPVFSTMTPADIFIENGIVGEIGRELRVVADKTIDASGMIVAPALVDMHVHLRDPGQTKKEDIASGSASAIRGGVGTVACMPNTLPSVDCPEIVSYVKEKSKEAGNARVMPIAAVSQGQKGKELTDFAALKESGAVAVSDDGFNIDNAALMRAAMVKAKEVGLPILCHCEDSSLALNHAVNEGDISRKLWMDGRPAIAEELVVMRDVMLSEETGAPVHICHVSTGKSVDIIRKAKKAGIPVTCETCPQYFSLSEEEILSQGTLARVNPPLRTKKDVRAIVNGLKDGTIDVIASDHAPHTAEEKARSLNRAPSGIVGLETLLSLSLTYLYHSGKVYLPQLFHMLSSKPAAILGVDGGRIAVGKSADIVIFHLSQEWAVNPDVFLSKGKNSPYRDFVLKGRVKYTIVEGKVLHSEGPQVPSEVSPE
ncbi:MAG: dihydroorotase [Eubacteriales bacterium]